MSRLTRREFFCGLGAMAVAAGVSLPIGLGPDLMQFITRGIASKFVERAGAWDLYIWNIALTSEEVHLLAEGVSPALIRPGQLVSVLP